MQIKLYSLVSFLLPLAAFAQSQSVSLTGKVSHPVSDEVTVSYYRDFVDFEVEKVTAQLSPDRTFYLQVPVDHPTLATLQHGDEMQEIFLEPGGQMQIKFKGTEIDQSIRFKGHRAVENNYLQKCSILFDDDELFHYSTENIYLNEEAYTKMLDEKRFYQLAHYRKTIAKYPELSEDFKKWALAEIEYNIALQRLDYPELRAKLTRLPDPYDLSTNYYDFLGDLPVNNENGLRNLAYFNFLDGLVGYQHRTVNSDHQSTDYFDSKFLLATALLNGPQEDIICQRILKDAFAQAHIEDVEKTVSDYASMNGDPKKINMLYDQLQKKRHLARGSFAPALTWVDPAGKQHSLDEYKGKAVYLYFYTPECNSCYVEQPHAQRLVSKFEDSPIEFVFVAVSNSQEQWKESAANHPWAGQFGKAKNDPNKVKEIYQLTSFPSAVVIDHEGRTMDLHAKRPCTLGLEQDLKTLLYDIEVRTLLSQELPSADESEVYASRTAELNLLR
jgi:thiol-disulfide isomerase/thioredoxin